MKPSILVVDTLDDRREIWSLLHRMSPRARVGFLNWCCGQVRQPNGNGPVPMGMERQVREAYRDDDGNDRLTNAVYGDLLLLSSQWNLDLVKAAEELERRVRRPSSSPSPRA